MRGFIPISPEWTTLSHTRLVTATEKLISVATAHGDANDAPEQEPITESEEMIMAILEGFAPINLVETKGESVMTVTPSSIKFNKATAVELGYPAYARLLVNAKENKVALQGWPKKDDCSFEFSSPEGQQTYGAIFIPNLFSPHHR